MEEGSQLFSQVRPISRKKIRMDRIQLLYSIRSGGRQMNNGKHDGDKNNGAAGIAPKPTTPSGLGGIPAPGLLPGSERSAEPIAVRAVPTVHAIWSPTYRISLEPSGE